MQKFLLKLITLSCLLTIFSPAAMAMVWGQGKWGTGKWGNEVVQGTVTPPDGPIPESPKVRTLTGASTSTIISAGAYKDVASPVYGSTFTAGDIITIIAEVKPEAADVGKNGSLFVVLLSIIGGQQQWSFLNSDGNFESWNLKLGTLGAAATKTPLEATNAITIFEGSLQAGKHRMAIGYQASGGQLIYTAKAININVSN